MSDPQPTPDVVDQVQDDDEVFDLDAAPRPARADGEEHPKPFKFGWKGRRFTLVDPAQTSWQNLQLGLRTPASFFRFCVDGPDEDKDFLIGTAMPSWQLAVIMERYFKHYKFDPSALGGMF